MIGRDVVDTNNLFREVKRHPDRFFIIHYSSEHLYDEGLQGLSPRITSVVAMHFSTRQTLSFALHVEAETLGIARDSIVDQYDRIERALLERFYEFVREHRTNYWIDWNMRNQTYGFEHLEHRYRLLTAHDPPVIPVEVRINLNDALQVRYGQNYAADPKMPTLMRLNGPIDPRFMTGAEESEAFKNLEFIRMNSPTISKIEFFRFVIEGALHRRLRTGGNRFVDRIDKMLDSRWSRVVLFLFGLLGGVLTLLNIASRIQGR
jgi:hypothetical protein